MSGPRIKVTDKRKFTPEGNLREEYRSSKTEATTASRPDEQTSGTAGADDPNLSPQSGPSKASTETPLREPGNDSDSPLGPSPDQPSFFDLVSALAQPAALYMGEVEAPGGGPPQDLRLARVYIDLLGELRRTTTGNLTPQEAQMLDDTLGQLRMLYVQKQG